ncbi:FAD-dependent oxidoreductase [Longirhabdus pacifica]|uniref:FAD-dependent oxidoreductase n=1 Tax=Longirhabdus pacifica TaxID=2305227 RepID=UPI001008D10C|nr:FAD-dependent oxidoreductase [Longirhabdus pacifica]
MKTLILVGGGHAHLFILHQLKNHKLDNVQVCLISTSTHQYYSGMLSGYAEGIFQQSEIRVNLRQLCKQAGVMFMQEKVEHIDPVKQNIVTLKGKEITYDLISFNIGSVLNTSHVPGADQYAMLIKPYDQLPQQIEKVRQSENVIIVGGGASGVEISLALQSWRNQHDIPNTVHLISQGNILHEVSKKATNIVTQRFQQVGVSLHQHNQVLRVEKDIVHVIHTQSKAKQTLPYDTLIWLAGVTASSIFKYHHTLETDEAGYLFVNNQLQSTSFSNVFGVGDCVSFKHHAHVTKTGVYAVKAAETLWHNLLAYVQGTDLKTYKPQRHYLAILSTGHRQALLKYGTFVAHGRWCWTLKKKIDTSFIKKYIE